jgi:hypothetical protein
VADDEVFWRREKGRTVSVILAHRYLVPVPVPGTVTDFNGKIQIPSESSVRNLYVEGYVPVTGTWYCMYEYGRYRYHVGTSTVQ